MGTEITNLISVEVGFRMQDMMVKIRFTLNTKTRFLTSTKALMPRLIC
jgi:hypothetical protein